MLPSRLTERHVLLLNNQPTDPFLPMSTTEFVSQFGSPHLTQNILHNELMLRIGGENHPVNGGRVVIPVFFRLLAPLQFFRVETDLLLVLSVDDRDHFVHENIVFLQPK